MRLKQSYGLPIAFCGIFIQIAARYINLKQYYIYCFSLSNSNHGNIFSIDGIVKALFGVLTIIVILIGVYIGYRKDPNEQLHKDIKSIGK